MYYNNLINNNFYYKKINKNKNILNLKKKILLILKNNKINNFNIILKKGKFIFNKNKINRKILYLIKKEILNYLIIIKYNYYKKKIGTIINLIIKNIIDNLLILIDIYKNIFYYKLKDKNQNKYYKINYNYKFLIIDVIYNNKNLKIILSRNSKLFIKKILKLEIPEINNGLIKIKKIVRIPGPGGLVKIIVYSKNKKINVLGSCIGIKGLRLKNILKELNNEKINIIKYSNNIYKYLKRLFNKINFLKIKVIENKIYLIYNKNDIYKFIGKYGNNIKLCKLLLNKYKFIVKCV
ncbi:MAG: hypothetical protein NHG14_00510 [Candidatus Shikimatogenerans bostrichidophilus]|nr:MAG: hypothetical protein NHG14_00510 [Candidatus Shikimatogenerans bostrichidophilus]